MDFKLLSVFLEVLKLFLLIKSSPVAIHTKSTITITQPKSSSVIEKQLNTCFFCFVLFFLICVYSIEKLQRNGHFS